MIRTTVGDLAKHLGKRVEIPGLHQPGADWDAPKVSVTGRVVGLRPVLGPFAAVTPAVWVDLVPRGQLDRPLPIGHPVLLL